MFLLRLVSVDMSGTYYSIKELESYSGIKAHTIRIWEKRYNLLDPSRSDSNIRLYDDDQLVKLLNTVTLLESGWKISKISQLSKEELIASTQKCLEVLDDTNFHVPINALITAMFAFDEKELESVLDTCYHKLGVYTTMRRVVYPFLNRVGLMWRLEELTPAQEHFASNIIRQKLVSAINILPSKEDQEQGGFALFLPYDEYHELGLLLAQYMLKQRDQKVYYFGGNTPVSSVQTLVERKAPEVLLTFLITRRPLEEIQQYIEDLANIFPKQKLWLVVHDSIAAQIDPVPDNCQFITNLEDFENMI